jgi:hypothetical protein
MATSNLTERRPGNEASSMDVLQFAVLKADAIESFDENPFGVGNRAWHSLINRVLAELPRNVIQGTAFPHRIYGYEVERSGADQIIDLIHDFDKFTAPEHRRYHDDGRISEHGIQSCLTQEVRFLDALQHDPTMLSTRGLARIRKLQMVQSMDTVALSGEEPAAPSTIIRNIDYLRLTQEDTTVRLTTYGSRYLQYAEETYHV